MNEPLRVLLLEDNANDAELVLRALRQAGFEPDWRRVELESEFLAALDSPPDLILADYSLPQFDGLHALKLVRERLLDLPFIIVSGTIGEDVAVNAMRHGATDYLLKDRLSRLGDAVRSALQRTRLLREYRRDQELLRTLMQASPVALIAIDPQAIVLTWNPAAERLFGWTAAEVIGRPIPIVPEEDRTFFDTLIAGEIEGETRQGLEMRRLRKDGSLVNVSLWTAPLREANGEIIGTIGMMVDISERKQAEEAIRSSEQRFRALIENSFDAITLNRPDGTIAYASPSIDRVLGYSAEELTGTEAYALLHPEDIARINSKVQDIEASNNPRAVDVHRVRQKDGSWRWIEAVATNLLDDPNVGAIVGNLRDVTERIQAEQELRDSRNRLTMLSSQLLTSQESERRHLARELHDQIGQELTSIKLNLKALEPLVPAGVELVHETLTIAEQTLQQVRSLALDLRPSMLDDIGLAPALRWYLDRQAHRSGFAPHFLAEPPEITVSPEVAITCFRVAQESLTNIARHAHAHNVRIEVRQYETALDLQVHDDGIGFDVEAETDQASRGASIGLLGMRERAELIGGLIDIESNSAIGTTIHARFPLKRETALALEISRNTQASGSQETDPTGR